MAREPVLAAMCQIMDFTFNEKREPRMTPPPVSARCLDSTAGAAAPGRR